MQRTKGPPGGTPDIVRNAITQQDLSNQWRFFDSAVADIAEQRNEFLAGRPNQLVLIKNDSEDDDDEEMTLKDPEWIRELKRWVNSPDSKVRDEARQILGEERWQHLNRIERNIIPMRDAIYKQLNDIALKNYQDGVMARGEGKPMNGGSTIPERGLAAEIRELHPLVNSGDRGTDSRVGQFNLLLNQVVHDKTTAPFDREGMKLIRAVARNDRFEDLGRAPAVPPEALVSNQENNRRVQALIPVIKSPQKAPRVPGAISASVAPGEAEGSVPDENQAPRLPLHMMRGEMWEEGRNRRYF